jgi:hypothetical protein
MGKSGAEKPSKRRAPSPVDVAADAGSSTSASAASSRRKGAPAGRRHLHGRSGTSTTHRKGSGKKPSAKGCESDTSSSVVALTSTGLKKRKRVKFSDVESSQSSVGTTYSPRSPSRSPDLSDTSEDTDSISVVPATASVAPRRASGRRLKETPQSTPAAELEEGELSSPGRPGPTPTDTTPVLETTGGDASPSAAKSAVTPAPILSARDAETETGKYIVVNIEAPPHIIPPQYIKS